MGEAAIVLRFDLDATARARIAVLVGLALLLIVTSAFDNAYLLEFDEDGRCRSFTEFYVERPTDRV